MKPDPFQIRVPEAVLDDSRHPLRQFTTDIAGGLFSCDVVEFFRSLTVVSAERVAK